MNKKLMTMMFFCSFFGAQFLEASYNDESSDDDFAADVEDAYFAKQNYKKSRVTMQSNKASKSKPNIVKKIEKREQKAARWIKKQKEVVATKEVIATNAAIATI